MSSGFSHRTPDLGVLPDGRSLPALRPLVDALLSLALTLGGRTFTCVRPQFSIVRHLLAVVGESVPLIGDAISFISDPLAPRKLSLTPRECLVVLIGLGSAAIELTRHTATVLGDHDSP